MICVSVGEKDYNNAIKVASLYNFAEIRLDLLDAADNKVDNKIIKKIFSSHKNLIATYREKNTLASDTGADAPAKRFLALKAAVESGATFVDIDINENNDFISSVKSLCTDGTRLIISYHDHEETPSFATLDKIVTQALEKGADVVKIACSVNKAEHVERLLSMPDYYSPIKIVIAGMGKHGSRVRILSEAAGSFFTYASHDMQSCTAEGQLDYKTILEEQRKIVSGW